VNVVADYHTHTIYSHGKGTILDNVIAARKKGLKRIAIADHGFGHFGFGIKLDDLPHIRQEIDEINRRFDDIQVLLGIEANLTGVNGEIDIPDELLGTFDIILMGFHKAVFPNSIRDGWNLFLRNAIDSINPFGGRQLRQQNTRAIINAIMRYPINIITHPGAKIDIDSRLLARASAERNVALEINASHGFMSVEYVKIAMEEGASFVINSDAHVPKNVGVFDKGIRIAREAGLPPERIINTLEAYTKD
jgi:putative hydrolase